MCKCVPIHVRGSPTYFEKEISRLPSNKSPCGMLTMAKTTIIPLGNYNSALVKMKQSGLYNYLLVVSIFYTYHCGLM